MPIYTRRGLRQRLGIEYLHDTIVGTTTGSNGPTQSAIIWDSTLADPTLSGENPYYRAWVRTQTPDTQQPSALYDARVATLNTQSGAFVITGTSSMVISSGNPYEIHNKISPADKDRSLDAVIKDLRFIQEYPLWSVKDAKAYSLGTDIYDVVDVKYFSDPTNSLDRGVGHLQWFSYAITATGQELRINPSLPASYQIILSAIITVSLQSATTHDTVNFTLPSDDWVLSGAAAHLFWMMEQDSPGQESTLYRAKRIEMAKLFSKLSRRFQPFIARKISLGEVW